MPNLLARKSLKPQLNQIRTWVRQGRTDAWIAHQLEVSVRDLAAFKREHGLAPPEDDDAIEAYRDEEELDLRAEDDALIAAALDAEEAKVGDDDDRDDDDQGDDDEDEDDDGEEDGDEDRPRRRRRGRRGGRGRGRGGAGAAAGGRGRGGRALEGTFDHGEEGYGLWLDPAIQDDPVYAEHWKGHRPVTVTVTTDRIVIERAGEEAEADDDGESSEAA